jgi:hypothetical protein
MLVVGATATTVELLTEQPSDVSMNLTFSLVPFQVVVAESSSSTVGHDVLTVLLAKYLKDNMFADSRTVSQVQKVQVSETAIGSNTFVGKIHLEATASLFRKSHVDIEQEYWLADRRDVLQSFLSEELQDASLLITDAALLQESFVLDLIPFSVQVSTPVTQRPLTLAIAMYLEGNMYQDHNNKNNINTTYQRQLQTQQPPPPPLNDPLMVAVNLISSPSSPTGGVGGDTSNTTSVAFNYTGSVGVYLSETSSASGNDNTATTTNASEWISSVHNEQVFWLLTQSAVLNDTIQQHLIVASLVEVRVDGHEPNETTDTASNNTGLMPTSNTTTTNGTDPGNKNAPTGNNLTSSPDEPSNANDSTPAAGQQEKDSPTTKHQGGGNTTSTTSSSWESSRWMTITLVAVVIGSVSMALVLIWARKKHARPARRKGRRNTSGGGES